MAVSRSDVAALSELSCLDDPVRRRLYDHIAASDEPISRDDAATAVGIGRTLAAYHLDKLADAGLLRVGYSRPPGRAGPGAGRPAKWYSRAERELAVSVPPRNYELLARLLADAVESDGSGTVRGAVSAAAHRAGAAAVDDLDAAGSGAGESGDAGVMTALSECGYEPARTEDGSIELRNCPFHQLAWRHPELICGLNRSLVQGLLDAAGRSDERAVLRSRPGRCCVLVAGAGDRKTP